MVEYGDGALELLRPGDLHLEKIMPRFSLEESYEGKHIMEEGMQVRLRWDKNYRRCPATVRAVGPDYSLMSARFDEIRAQLVDNSAKVQSYSGRLS